MNRNEDVLCLLLHCNHDGICHVFAHTFSCHHKLIDDATSKDCIEVSLLPYVTVKRFQWAMSIFWQLLKIGVHVTKLLLLASPGQIRNLELKAIITVAFVIRTSKFRPKKTKIFQLLDCFWGVILYSYLQFTHPVFNMLFKLLSCQSITLEPSYMTGI